MNIKFQAPDSTTPGFLKRQRRAAKFLESVQGGKIAVDVIDDLVEFLLDFVTEPTNREEARDGVLEASQDQFSEMLKAIMGAKEAVPNQNDAP